MLQAWEATLDRSISGLKAKAGGNWSWFTWSSPWSLCPSFPLFQLGSSSYKKQTPFKLPQKQQYMIRASVSCDEKQEAVVRTRSCFRDSSLFHSLSLILSPLLSNYLFSLPFSLLANFPSHFIVSALVEFQSLHQNSLVCLSYLRVSFHPQLLCHLPFPALQCSISQTSLIGQVYLFFLGQRGHVINHILDPSFWGDMVHTWPS